MLLQITLIVLISLAVSLILNKAMLSLAPQLGLMDQPGERRIHATPIPRAGGMAIWVTFVLVTACIILMQELNQSEYLSWGWFSAFVAGSLILMIAGIVDDRGGLSAYVKLACHFAAPAVFYALHPIASGLFPEPWAGYCDPVFFVVWAVVLINAFNLIDGLDGLCGGLAAVTTVLLSGLAIANGRIDSAIVLLVMGGAIFGFLRYNMNPARIFLGDAGSMLLGFFLATVATEAVGRKAVIGAVMLPIAIAGVPLLDVLLAIWRRSARRVVQKLSGSKVAGGIFDADRHHLHHRVLDSVGSQRNAALILQGIAIVLSVLSFLPMIFGDKVIGLSLVGFLVVGLVGIRNLARVEIEHTGSAIHLAIKLSGGRRRMATLLFVYDLLVLAGASTAAILIETNMMVRGGSFVDAWKFVVIFTVFGSIALLFVQVHHRLWVRATIRDMLSLRFALLTATIASFTLMSFVHSGLEWSVLRLSLISMVLACAGVCLPRTVLDAMRELGLEARHRKKRPIDLDEEWPAVVLGAGDLGTLLLDHLKSSSHEIYPGMRMLGFIDQNRSLRGRRLRSFKVFGDMSTVPQLAEKSGLRAIILAIENPSKELLDELGELSDQYNLRIYRWKVSLVPELMVA